MGDIAKIHHASTIAVPEVLAVEHLAALIHKSPASIRSDASRNPDALPPICRLPGNKRLLFRLEDVRCWLASHVQRTEITAPAVQLIARGRGRPRKVAP
jgi:hypothetical protein